MPIVLRCRPLLLAACAGLAVLAGCSRSPPEPAADTNDAAAAMPPPPSPVAPPAARVEPPPPKVSEADKPPPDPPADPDAQVQDDADATGMTARVSRTDPPADNGDGDAADEPAKAQ